MQNFEIQTMQDAEQFMQYVIEPSGLALDMGFLLMTTLPIIYKRMMK